MRAFAFLAVVLFSSLSPLSGDGIEGIDFQHAHDEPRGDEPQGQSETHTFLIQDSATSADRVLGNLSLGQVNAAWSEILIEPGRGASAGAYLWNATSGYRYERLQEFTVLSNDTRIGYGAAHSRMAGGGFTFNGTDIQFQIEAPAPGRWQLEWRAATAKDFHNANPTPAAFHLPPTMAQDETPYPDGPAPGILLQNNNACKSQGTCLLAAKTIDPVVSSLTGGSAYRGPLESVDAVTPTSSDVLRLAVFHEEEFGHAISMCDFANSRIVNDANDLDRQLRCTYVDVPRARHGDGTSNGYPDFVDFLEHYETSYPFGASGTVTYRELAKQINNGVLIAVVSNDSDVVYTNLEGKTRDVNGVAWPCENLYVSDPTRSENSRCNTFLVRKQSSGYRGHSTDYANGKTFGHELMHLLVYPHDVATEVSSSEGACLEFTTMPVIAPASKDGFCKHRHMWLGEGYVTAGRKSIAEIEALDGQ